MKPAPIRQEALSKSYYDFSAPGVPATQEIPN